ncbi:MAG: AIR synthase-related protein [Acidilobaceae archaeon]
MGGFDEWLNILYSLAQASGSTWTLDYDSTPFNSMLLVNIDGYASSESKLPWMSWSDWGWKATVASMADIIASGGRPKAIACSIGVSRLEYAYEIASGIGEVSSWANIHVLKCDTNRSHGDDWIDVAVLGYTLKPIPRSGARPGDLLVQVGPIGYGFLSDLALKGLIDIRDYPRVLEYTRRPKIQLDIGPRLGECSIRASIDNSDGWIATLYQLSLSSRVKIVVEKTIIIEEALDVASRIGVSEYKVLESWEDYNLALAVPPQNTDCILEYCKRYDIRCDIIGRVELGSRVYYKDVELKPIGWTWVD